jgi:hypothetical protein
MCRRMKVASFVEPEIADAIDRIVARRMKKIEKLKKSRWGYWLDTKVK